MHSGWAWFGRSLWPHQRNMDILKAWRGGPAMLKGSGENTAKLDLLSHMSGLRAVLTSCTHLLDNASPGEAGRPAGAPDTDWPSFTWQANLEMMDISVIGTNMHNHVHMWECALIKGASPLNYISTVYWNYFNWRNILIRIFTSGETWCYRCRILIEGISSLQECPQYNWTFKLHNDILMIFMSIYNLYPFYCQYCIA